MKDTPVTQPIFFVGAPRSGTSILFESFARHEDLGWNSTYSRINPRWLWLNALRRVLDNRFIRLTGRKDQYGRERRFNRLLPKPRESYDFWNHVTGRRFDREFLIDERADETARHRTRRAVGRVQRWQGKPRFAAKMTGPSRITFLDSIFPDAIFIHVIRDGRAVVGSLLHVGFWLENEGLTRPWWIDGLSDSAVRLWQEADNDPAVLAGVQWSTIIEVARREGASLPDGRYIEVRYEDFVADPPATLSRLYEACSLSDSADAHEFMRLGPVIRNMNDKYSAELQNAKAAEILAALEPALGNLGYAESPPTT